MLTLSAAMRKRIHASDRGAYSRFTRAVAEAELTRFLKADYTADRFSWSVDQDAVAQAELFDGKLALITNAPDLTQAEAVARYKALADIERGFRVLKSDIEIAPVHHRLPDRIRAHALICFLGRPTARRACPCVGVAAANALSERGRRW